MFFSKSLKYIIVSLLKILSEIIPLLLSVAYSTLVERKLMGSIPFLVRYIDKDEFTSWVLLQKIKLRFYDN